MIGLDRRSGGISHRHRRLPYIRHPSPLLTLTDNTTQALRYQCTLRVLVIDVHAANITNRKMFSADITNRDPAEILLKNTADREFPQERVYTDSEISPAGGAMSAVLPAVLRRTDAGLGGVQ